MTHSAIYIVVRMALLGLSLGSINSIHVIGPIFKHWAVAAAPWQQQHMQLAAGNPMIS